MSASQPAEPYEGLDLLDIDLHTDNPWPLYDYLLEHEPVYWDDHNRIWGITRYEDIQAISVDVKRWTSTEGPRPCLPPDESMICKDGRAHVMQRRLVSKGFTPGRVARLEESVADLTKSLVDSVAERGECDLIEDLAAPLPLRIIAGMLGYPDEDLPMLRAWTDEFVKGGSGPVHVTEEVNAAFENFMMYHMTLVEMRKACPGPDIISAWLDSEIDGEKLNDVQLLFEHALMIVGGSESTRNAIAGGLHALMQNRDQWEWLRENPGGMDNAVEEILRWTTPFVSMARTATCDVELHGKTIKKGYEVKLIYPAANRDPRHFPDPHRFDIRRELASPVLSFGHGPHYCLGASLAKLEMKLMIGEVLRRLPDMQMAPGKEMTRQASSFLRTITSVPVVFTPQPTA